MAEAGIVSKEGATDFELEPGQWGELDEDGVFAWNAPDGTPLIQDFGEPGGEGLESFDSTEITLPPDRVRFATLVNLKEVGAESYFEGVLVNLSTQGVACVSSHQLSGGAQVWITFRLGLADEPVSILCEVVWERVSDEAEPGYGLKFVDIADDVRERIEEVVRERSEGRAVEWPVIQMPERSSAPRTGVNPWLSGLLGGVIGLALAFVMLESPLPEWGVTAMEGTPAPAIVPEKRAAISNVQASPVKKADSKPVPAVPAEKAAPIDEGLTGLSAASAKSDVSVIVERSVSSKAPVAAPVVPSPKVGVSSATENTLMTIEGDQLVPVVDSPELVLELQTGKLVTGYKTFWLSNPRRIVVDVLDNTSGFERLAYTVKHPLVNQLRVGQYQTKVRFVVETADNATGKSTIKDGRLLIELKPR